MGQFLGLREWGREREKKMVVKKKKKKKKNPTNQDLPVPLAA